MLGVLVAVGVAAAGAGDEPLVTGLLLPGPVLPLALPDDAGPHPVSVIAAANIAARSSVKPPRWVAAVREALAVLVEKRVVMVCFRWRGVTKQLDAAHTLSFRPSKRIHQPLLGPASVPASLDRARSRKSRKIAAAASESRRCFFCWCVNPLWAMVQSASTLVSRSS